jgi:hypothetical protein
MNKVQNHVAVDTASRPKLPPGWFPSRAEPTPGLCRECARRIGHKLANLLTIEDKDGPALTPEWRVLAGQQTIGEARAKCREAGHLGKLAAASMSGAAS